MDTITTRELKERLSELQGQSVCLQGWIRNHRRQKNIGFIDFFTAGTFLLVYMRRGLQDELDEILGHRTQRYSVAYLLGIPTLFVYTLVWMARIAEELRAKAIELGIEGKLTSYRHMFDWNVFGLFLMGPAVATQRFFDTLNKVERELNRRNGGTE